MSNATIERRPFLLGVSAAAVAVAASSAIAQGRSPSGIAVPVTGLVSGTAQEVYGTLSISNALVQDGVLLIQGLLRLSNGGAQQVQLPVQNAGTSCQILSLFLGPLDLTLLGLRIQLDPINLRITAQRGGGLLGDLLCSLSGLLSGSGSLTQIASLLNQLLGLFR